MNNHFRTKSLEVLNNFVLFFLLFLLTISCGRGWVWHLASKSPRLQSYWRFICLHQVLLAVHNFIWNQSRGQLREWGVESWLLPWVKLELEQVGTVICVTTALSLEWCCGKAGNILKAWPIGKLFSLWGCPSQRNCGFIFVSHLLSCLKEYNFVPSCVYPPWFATSGPQQ